MLRTTILAASMALASAFAPSAPLARASTRAAVRRGPVMQQFSKSIPFLERPKNLDGTIPGDAGFDPLGFSDYYDLKWMREGEIKNGRVAMLAALGCVAPEFVRLPQFKAFSSNPLEAAWQLSPLGWIQIFVFIGIVESFSYENIYYGNREPGDLGFDPLRLGANPATLAHYKVAEIKNGRLAMIGVGGFVHQAILTKSGPITQIAEQNFVPKAFSQF